MLAPGHVGPVGVKSACVRLERQRPAAPASTRCVRLGSRLPDELAWRRSCIADWHEQAQRQPESLQGGRPRAAGRRHPPGAQQAEARAEPRSRAVRDAPGSSGRYLAGRPVDISERARRREHAAGERFEWRDDLEAGEKAASNRRCSASAQADRDSPLAEKGVDREEAILIHYEVTGHEHRDAIKENRKTAIPGHRQEICRLRWKEGIRRESN